MRRKFYTVGGYYPIIYLSQLAIPGHVKRRWRVFFHPLYHHPPASKLYVRMSLHRPISRALRTAHYHPIRTVDMAGNNCDGNRSPSPSKDTSHKLEKPKPKPAATQPHPTPTTTAHQPEPGSSRPSQQAVIYYVPAPVFATSNSNSHSRQRRLDDFGYGVTGGRILGGAEGGLPPPPRAGTRSYSQAVVPQSATPPDESSGERPFVSSARLDDPSLSRDPARNGRARIAEVTLEMVKAGVSGFTCLP